MARVGRLAWAPGTCWFAVSSLASTSTTLVPDALRRWWWRFKKEMYYVNQPDVVNQCYQKRSASYHPCPSWGQRQHLSMYTGHRKPRKGGQADVFHMYSGLNAVQNVKSYMRFFRPQIPVRIATVSSWSAAIKDGEHALSSTHYRP